MSFFQHVVCGLIACLGSAAAVAAPLPGSMLIFDQSNVRGPFYYEVFSSLRSTVNASGRSPITLYVESLDLSRFSGEAYEESLKAYLRAKYRDRSVGVLVAIGSASLDYVMRLRADLWPGVPVVFGMVDEPTITQMNLPSDVTGSMVKLRFEDMMATARAVVPDLERVAIVGDPLERSTVYRHFIDEIPSATAKVAVSDLTGLPLKEVRKRVAALPDRTAILYVDIHSDGEGTYLSPSDALELVSQAANRPIVVNAETFLGRGGIGGFVLTPAAIGQDTARVALLVLGGTPASSIPITVGDAVRPIFDWRQLQRWGVPESRLPSRSEIRFRDRSAWDQYRWQIVTIALVLILQMILIIGLLTEHQRRRRAELESRRRASELAHMNRHATAGELSASIAHEINQPLGSILNNTESAILILGSASPNLDEVKEILNDIKRDDERAGEVILRLRRLLKKAEVETREFDLNETAREVLQFLAAEAALRNITLSSRLMPEPLLVRGDHVQLQQVILNLVVNGMESIADAPTGRRVIIGRTALLDHRSAQVSIADSGPGIPPDDLKRVFEPFFTTKEKGMGMGLSISRTIIEAHGGAIWAENQAAGGATFHVSLPLVKPH